MRQSYKIIIIILSLSIALEETEASPLDSIAKKRKSKLFNQFVGLDLGFTNTSMYGTQMNTTFVIYPGTNFYSKPGVQLDFIFKNEFSNFIYLKSGISLVQKKGYIDGNNAAPGNKIEPNFLSIPLFMGVQPINSRNSRLLKFSIEFGLSLSKVIDQNDNLELGYNSYQSQTFLRPNTIQSFIAGSNIEIKMSKKLTGFINYRFSKDLNYYFSRRLIWYDVFLQKDVEKRYDVWMQCNSLSMGILYQLGNKEVKR